MICIFNNIYDKLSFIYSFTMALPFLFQLLVLIILLNSPLASSSSASSSSPPHALRIGSSLSVEKNDDILISPNELFTAGFYSVGQNTYCFAIWFTKPQSDGKLAIVWMANRDIPVNGKQSKLSLLKTGNLVLRDADQQLPVWTTSTRDSTASAQLQLKNSGNLCLQKPNGQILWQSFGSPTDTLLPDQNLTKATALISSRSQTNYSSGFYKLYFDNDNVLRLVYDGPKITSVYWPNPELRAWDAGRSTYNSERSAAINSSGHFLSSDALEFYSTDSGESHQRRMTMDIDGNVRVYSLDESRGIWQVTWQAISQPCTIHGSCGENSTCTYDHRSGRKCSCLPRHKMINPTDWSYGCAPEFEPTVCANGDDSFLHLPHVDFYGYDAKYLPNYTLDACKEECANICNCKGIQYKFDRTNGYYLCYPKFLLLNGFRSVNFNGSMYIKLPTSILSSNYDKKLQEFSLNCSGKPTIELDRAYDKNQEKGSLKYMLVFTYAFGGLEIICIIYFFYRTQSSSGKIMQGYLQAATGFQRFSYAELKKASGNFHKEIGRGSGGVVYKGVLSDNRIAAIKRLNEAINYQGEAEFLAELSIIGRLNHMNLIEVWGYCVEGKHRLLVYEYMEHGSLAKNLSTNTLDWDNRFEIAVGTAKGLAYLHEECLEWVLHCDVKPHNILLDAKYNPKVADFGLSKLLDRDGNDDSGFTRVRGTRGYMAPEWLFVSLPITSKVDVYSYGVVMLEMITGREPTCAVSGEDNGGSEKRLVGWLKEKILAGNGKNTWIQEIVDSTVKGDYDMDRMENLIKVALECAEEDKDARPTMSQVVDMLLHFEGDH